MSVDDPLFPDLTTFSCTPTHTHTSMSTPKHVHCGGQRLGGFTAILPKTRIHLTHLRVFLERFRNRLIRLLIGSRRKVARSSTRPKSSHPQLLISINPCQRSLHNHLSSLFFDIVYFAPMLFMKKNQLTKTFGKSDEFLHHFWLS